MSDNKLGISMAASWSWGASLVVGISILLARGFPAWAIWTGANVAAIPVFCLGYEKLKSLKLATSYKAFALPMLVIQVFAIWMNMQAIYEIMAGEIALDVPGLVSSGAASAFVIGLASLVLFLIYRFQFRGSAISDQFQFWGQVSLLVALIVLGAWRGAFEVPVWESAAGDWRWALWGGLGLIAGPYMDAMQWERIERADNRLKVGLIGGAAFGLYMLLVGLAATFLTGGLAVVALLFVCGLMVDTSTLDSAVSAKQYLVRKLGGGRMVAAAVTVAAIATWPFMSSLGAVTLWTIYASGRVFVWIAMIAFFVVAPALDPYGFDQRRLAFKPERW